MEYRPSESLKSVARELTSLILSHDNDHQRKEELLRQLPQLPAGEEEEQHESLTALPEDSIGIWRKSSEDGEIYYSRDADKQFEWALWANMHELRSPGKKRRVILLGESVARGYLYDPHYNVAMELEAILNGRYELEDTEVIDLARIGMGIEGLTEIVRSCIALKPDQVVIFAGNNWDPNLMASLGDEDNRQILKIFEKEAFPGVKSFIEKKFSDMVSGFLEIVSENLVKRGVPVVFVIPEFNLKDWKSDHTEQGLMWLPEGEMEKWLLAREAAECALRTNEIEKLGEAAARMTEINPSNPLGHEYLGHFYLVSKQFSEARKSFELSRDTVLFTGGTTRPRCYKVIRDQIVTEAPALGIKVIDLPAIFERTFPGSIPDRALFLDYCHLTVEGIKLAMRHTAQAVLETMTGVRVELADIRASDLCPDKHIQAIAHFGAAIHNAHNGQLTDILRYHCSSSLACSPEIKNTMIKFIDFSTRYASSLFCQSFEEIISEGEMRQYEGGLLALSHPKGRKLMDIALVDAIETALHSVDIDLKDSIKKLRISEHGIGADGINLLESFYCTTNYNEFMGTSSEIFLQSRTTESNFNFVLRNKEDLLGFTITCRTPGRDHPEHFIKIYVNGRDECLTEIPLSRQWTTHSFTINGSCLKEGVNRLIIHWPYTYAPPEVEKRITRHSITRTMYPVLGEIFSLTVTGKRVQLFQDETYGAVNRTLL